MLRNEWEIDASALIPEKFTFENGTATVEFEVGKMGMGPTGRDLSGFELAGEDKVFYPATARVNKDCRSITVSSPCVPFPVAVRYGIKNWPEAPLFNSFSIPASPFRSDDWER